MTAVEWLYETLWKQTDFSLPSNIFEQAKEMEKKETLKRQLFIGKVSEIIGAEKTIELLKEVNSEIE